MDVFQNLFLRKIKTQEDEISDILFKRRKTSIVTIWSKLLLQLPALHQVCYRSTGGNQEVLIKLGTQDGGKMAS